MRIWLTLALLSSVAGCAGDHLVEPGNDAGWHSIPAYDAGALPRDGGPIPSLDAGAASACHDVAITRAHVPAAVRLGATVPVHVASDTSSFTSCGCDTRASLSGAGQVSLAACDCCLDCDCIDFGYEATVSLPGPALPGPVGVAVEGALVPIPTTIVDPAACVGSAARVTELRPLAPDARLRQGSPAGGWVELRAYEPRCCGEPLQLVTPVLAADGAIDLTLADCNPDLCECASDEPHDASTPVYLGSLSPGTYTVRAGTASTTITIP